MVAPAACAPYRAPCAESVMAASPKMRLGVTPAKFVELCQAANLQAAAPQDVEVTVVSALLAWNVATGQYQYRAIQRTLEICAGFCRLI